MRGRAAPLTPMRMAFALCALALLMAVALPAAAASRVALLVGNATYQNPSFDLRNPLNDVKALETALEALGFDVIVAQDTDADGMRQAIAAFRLRMTGAEIGLFFYAGHGVQVAGDNYLLASNLSGISGPAVQDAAVTLSEVRAAFEAAGPELGIIILDACRDNPLIDAGAGLVDGPGLTRSRGGAGVLIAYATDPGAVAFDGSGVNSVFTEALLSHIATPGLDVRLMFGRVRQAVVVSTDGAQVPWVEESVLGEFYLNTSPTDDNRAALIDRDVKRWREVSTSLKPEPYRAYLEEFPEGMFREFAESRLARFSMVPSTNPSSPSGPFDPARFVAEAEPERLATALRLLGYLPEAGTTPPPEQLERSLEALVAQSPDPQGFAGETVYLEAARINVFLGVRIGDRIRAHIADLVVFDIAMARAQAAYAEAEELVASGKLSQAELDAALGPDMRAIGAAQTKILTRLDQYRLYYEELITSAGTHFGTLMSPALVGLDGSGQRGLGDLAEEAQRDIRLFLKHARLTQNEATRGTMTWLSDYLPQNR
ncbi:MAG: caspase family protein [Pseudomonadota bacterium]